MFSSMCGGQHSGNLQSYARQAHLGKPRSANVAKYVSCVKSRRFRVTAFADNEAVNEGRTMIDVKLEVPFQARWGEHLKVVGNTESLGGWEIDHAPEMCWTEGDIWTANLSIPTDSCIEYKLVHIIPGQAPQWEFSPNRTLTFQAGSPARALSLAWCDPVPVTAEDESPEDDSVDSLTIPFSSDDASSAELAVAINDTEQSMMAVAAETTVEDEPIPEEIPGKEEIVLPSVVVMEDAAPSDVSAVLELGQDEFETDASSNDGSNFLEGAARTAGYVALGVAGAAMLSAFAIDVADTAVLGAVVAAAGGAALSSKNGSAAKKKDSLSEDGTENTDEIEEPLITGAGQPGVVIAAGILSALDAGKSVAKALSGESETREDA